MDYFSKFWNDALQSLGYSCIYAKRPGRKWDGCCIAFSSRFVALQHYVISYNDLKDIVSFDKEEIDKIWKDRLNDVDDEFPVSVQKAAELVKKQIQMIMEGKKVIISYSRKLLLKSLQTPSSSTNSSFPLTMNTNNIALIVVLEDRESTCCSFRFTIAKQKLIVADTHLYWDPTYHIVKLYQSMYLLAALKVLRAEIGNLPIFIAMDANSLPHSLIYNYYCHL